MTPFLSGASKLVEDLRSWDMVAQIMRLGIELVYFQLLYVLYLGKVVNRVMESPCGWLLVVIVKKVDGLLKKVRW